MQAIDEQESEEEYEDDDPYLDHPECWRVIGDLKTLQGKEVPLEPN